MNRRLLTITIILFVSFLICSIPLEAYNFLYIHPTTGQPIGWELGTTIHYYVDPGSLGRLTNEQALTLVQEAMKIWEEASSDANVPHFEFAGYLSEDVNGTNYEQYLSASSCYTDDLTSCPSDAQKNLQTVIVFDEDGSILDNELCRITLCGAVGGARVFNGNSSDPGNIVQGILVMGPMDGYTVSSTTGLIAHELGHLLGLAHTSVNEGVYINYQTTITDEAEGMFRYVPSMFFSDSGYADQTMVTLSPDDIAGISALYPSDTFLTDTATIKGQILKSDGSPMMHVNVIARNVDDPLCEAFSWLSARECDAFLTSDCEQILNESPELISDPGYTIQGLPPGSYSLEVEEVANDSLAMTLAPGIGNPFIYGDAEFWNEGDAAGDASYLTSSTITLAAGVTRENIDIILNRSEVTDDRIKYIPLDTFTPGPGTRCPSEPPVDYAGMIGIDEGGSGDTDGTTDTTGSSGGCSLVR